MRYFGGEPSSGTVAGFIKLNTVTVITYLDRATRITVTLEIVV